MFLDFLTRKKKHNVKISKISIEERMYQELFQDKLNAEQASRTRKVLHDAKIPLARELANLLLFAYDKGKYEQFLTGIEKFLPSELYRAPENRFNNFSGVWLAKMYEGLDVKPFVTEHPEEEKLFIKTKRITITDNIRKLVENGEFIISNKGGMLSLKVAGIISEGKYVFSEDILKKYSRRKMDWEYVQTRLVENLSELQEDFIIIPVKGAYVAISKYFFHQFQYDEIIFKEISLLKTDFLLGFLDNDKPVSFEDYSPYIKEDMPFLRKSVKFQKIVIITDNDLMSANFEIVKKRFSVEEAGEQAETMMRHIIYGIFDWPEHFPDLFSYIRKYDYGYEAVNAGILTSIIKRMFAHLDEYVEKKYQYSVEVDFQPILEILEKKNPEEML